MSRCFAATEDLFRLRSTVFQQQKLHYDTFFRAYQRLVFQMLFWIAKYVMWLLVSQRLTTTAQFWLEFFQTL